MATVQQSGILFLLQLPFFKRHIKRQLYQTVVCSPALLSESA